MTEAEGVGVTAEALSMLYTRYRFAVEFGVGKRILEVACGPGHGLGYLANQARSVVGGDYTFSLIRKAQRHYRGKIPVLRLDSHALPFRNASFDVIIAFEALYYFERPDVFLQECRRTLHEGGRLLLCTANKEWEGFNPSPFCTRYFSIRELSDLLQANRFRADFFCAFPVGAQSPQGWVVSRLRRLAVGCNLIPRTMKGKEALKRLFLGPLAPLPAEVHDGMAPYCPPESIAAHLPRPDCKVLFAVARAS